MRALRVVPSKLKDTAEINSPYFRCIDSKYLVTFSSRTLPKS